MILLRFFFFLGKKQPMPFSNSIEYTKLLLQHHLFIEVLNVFQMESNLNQKKKTESEENRTYSKVFSL